MTTIAYRSGTLAADRRLASGGVSSSKTRKIAQSPNGDIGGASGNLVDVAAFLDWIAQGCEGNPPGCKSQPHGYLIRRNGRVFEWNGCASLTPVRGSYFTAGSGWELALGAMAAGADAPQAVRIACRFDGQSGGGVDILHLPKRKR